jgi:hypothetical protein
MEGRREWKEGMAEKIGRKEWKWKQLNYRWHAKSRNISGKEGL